jgi:hypothetical protein
VYFTYMNEPENQNKKASAGQNVRNAIREVYFVMNRDLNTAAIFNASSFEELQAMFHVGIGLPDGTPANGIGRSKSEKAFLEKAKRGGTRVQSYSSRVVTEKVSAPETREPWWTHADEDYYIEKRGCSRETARTYLRTESMRECEQRAAAKRDEMQSRIDDLHHELALSNQMVSIESKRANGGQAELERVKQQRDELQRELSDTQLALEAVSEQRDELLAAAKPLATWLSHPNISGADSFLSELAKGYLGDLQAAIAKAEATPATHERSDAGRGRAE